MFYRLAAFAALCLFASSASAQSWTIDKSKDPLTDEAWTIIWVVSVEQSPPSTGSGSTLNLMCFKNPHIVFMIEGAYVGASGRVSVKYRVDGNPPRETSGYAISGHFVLMDEQAMSLASELYSAKQIYVEAYGAYGGDVTMRYDLAGIQETVTANWDLCAPLFRAR